MDDLVRLTIRQIGLGGLCGCSLSELWENIEVELRLNKEMFLFSSLDDFIKAKLWVEMLKSQYISHFTTNKSLPSISIFEQDTIINEPEAPGEGLVGLLGQRKDKSWHKVDVNEYLNILNSPSENNLIIALNQMKEIESKGSQYVLVADQIIRNRVLGLCGGGVYWRTPKHCIIQPRIIKPPPTSKNNKNKKQKEKKLIFSGNQIKETNIVGEDTNSIVDNEFTNVDLPCPLIIADESTSKDDADLMVDIDDKQISDNSKKDNSKINEIQEKEQEEELEKENNNDDDDDDKNEELKENIDEIQSTIPLEERYNIGIANRILRPYRMYFENEFFAAGKLSDIQYCVLEVIGKQRRKGLIQSKLHPLAKGKLSHPYRKLVHLNMLDREAVLYGDRVENSKRTFTQLSWIKNMGPCLYYLQDPKEFHHDIQPNLYAFLTPAQYVICSILASEEDQTLVERQLKQYYSKNIVCNPYRWGTFVKGLIDANLVALITAVVNDEPVPCIKLIGKFMNEQGDILTCSTNEPKNDEDNQGEDDEVVNLPIGMSTGRFLYLLIEESGTRGITQPQLREKTNFHVKFLLKQLETLKKHFGIVSLPEHKGKQVTYSLFTSQNYQKRLLEEQQIINVKDINNLSNTVVESPHKEVSVKTKSGTPNSTKKITTLQKSRRKKWILDLVTEKLIIDRSSLRSYITTKEGDSFEWSIDVKTIKKILKELEDEKLVNQFIIAVPLIAGDVKNVTAVTVPGITPKDKCYKDFLVTASENQDTRILIPPKQIERPLDTNVRVRSIGIKSKATVSAAAVAFRYGYIRPNCIRTRELHKYLWSLAFEQQNLIIQQSNESSNDMEIDDDNEEENNNIKSIPLNEIPSKECRSFGLTEIVLKMNLEIFLQVIGCTKEIDDLEQYLSYTIESLPLKIREQMFSRRSYAKRLHTLLDFMRELKLVTTEAIDILENDPKKYTTNVFQILLPSTSFAGITEDGLVFVKKYEFKTMMDIMNYWTELEITCQSIYSDKEKKKIVKKENLQEGEIIGDDDDEDDDEEEYDNNNLIKSKKLEELKNEFPDIIIPSQISKLSTKNWVISLTTINTAKRKELENFGQPSDFKSLLTLSESLGIAPANVKRYYDSLKASPRGTLIPLRQIGVSKKKKKKLTFLKRKTPRKARLSLWTKEDYETDYDLDPLSRPFSRYLEKKKNSSSTKKISDPELLSIYVSTIAERNRNSKQSLADLVSYSYKNEEDWIEFDNQLNEKFNIPIKNASHYRRALKKLLFQAKNRLTVSVQLYDALVNEKPVPELPNTLEELYDKYKVCQTYFAEDNETIDTYDTDTAYIWEIIQQLLVTMERDLHFHQLQTEVTRFSREKVKPLVDTLIRQEIIQQSSKNTTFNIPERSLQFSITYYLLTETLSEYFSSSNDSIFFARSLSPQFFYCVQYYISKLMDNSIFDDIKVYENFKMDDVNSGASVAALLSLAINDKIEIDISPNVNTDSKNVNIGMDTNYIPECNIFVSSKQFNLFEDPFSNFSKYSFVPLDMKLNEEDVDLESTGLDGSIGPSLLENDEEMIENNEIQTERENLGKRKEFDRENDDDNDDLPPEKVQKQKNTDDTIISKQDVYSIEKELRKLENFIENSGDYVKNIIDIEIISDIFRKIYNLKDTGIPISSFKESEYKDIEVYLNCLCSFKLAAKIIKGDISHIIATCYIPINLWFRLTVQGNEILIAPWFTNGKLNDRFMSGAFVRTLRGVISKPGITMFELQKSLPLLEITRVRELLYVLWESDYISVKLVEPVKIGLFTKQQETIAVIPNIIQFHQINARWLFLMPTQSSILFADACFYKQ